MYLYSDKVMVLNSVKCVNIFFNLTFLVVTPVNTSWLNSFFNT